LNVTFKSLINDIKCGKLASPVFTDADLANVKACLPEPVAPVAKEVKIPMPADNGNCINQGVEDVKAILINQMAKQATTIEIAVVKGRVQEALDHYTVISEYYKERLDFFNSTISNVEPLTSQFLYWTDEYTRTLAIENQIWNEYINNYNNYGNYYYAFSIIRNLSDSTFKTFTTYDSNKILTYLISEDAYNILISGSAYKLYYEARKNRIVAEENQSVAKQGATNALSEKISSLPPLGSASTTSQTLSSLCKKISGQFIPYFDNDQITASINIPAFTAAFGVRLIDLDITTINVPQIKQDGSSESIDRYIPVKENTHLTNKPFNNTLATFCSSIPIDSVNSNPFSNYDYIPGALYNKVSNGYPGLYRKFANPIQYFYTLAERGLSVDPNKIDPIFKGIENAPVSIKEGDTQFYIKSQAAYEKFYEKLNSTLEIKKKTEIEKVFPNQIKPTVDQLKVIAKREVADFFRRTTDVQLKLARPTSYRAQTSSIYSNGNFKYSPVDSVLPEKLAYYTKAYSEILEKIKECNTEIGLLEVKIKENSMDPDVLAKRIADVACFKGPSAITIPTKDCEAETLKKLGQDPLFIRTLGGNDASLPDMTNSCYWREFTKSLNKVSLLPIPDLTAPLFRYYPINNIIPTPLGIALIPIPQKWRTLFTLSTPVGTLVTFLTMPIAIVGIPLPSIYILYFAPDGNKYMLLAPNIPLVYMTPTSIKYGFEIDQTAASENPLGLDPANPFKGQLIKGSLVNPLAISGNASKAVRLTALAATLALGKNPNITTRDGTPIGEVDPITYIASYAGELEKMMNFLDLDLSNDFDKQIADFKRSMNLQFNKLGEIQLTAVTKLKDKTRKDRESQVMGAEGESDLKKKRESKKAARSLDPITLSSKISGVLDDFDKYIDKIKLGTISFPDSPTKLNPKLPSAISGLQPTIEKAAKGLLGADIDATNFIAKIKRMASQVDPTKLKSKKSFNLNKADDVREFKKAIKEYSNKALDYLQGNANPADEDIDPNLSDVEKGKIKKAAKLRKERLQKALTFTTLSVAAPNLKLFDPAAPCCPAAQPPLEVVSPQVLAALGVFNALLDALLSGLTIDVLKSLLGESLEEIGISAVTTLFNSLLGLLPPIILPEKPDIVSISQAIILPVLTALTVPQSPNPLGVPFPIQIVIPLDIVIKPLLKLAIAYLLELILRMLSDAGDMLTANQGPNSSSLKEILRQIPCGNSEFAKVSTTTSSKYVSITLPNGFNIKLPKIPMLPLDIVSYFALLTSTDLVELIKGLLNTAIDGILEPLKTIVGPILSLTKSLKDLSFTVVDSANPYILPIKLAIMAIQLKIPNSSKLKLANLDAINLLKAAYIPVITFAEPVVKELAYLVSILACSFGNKPGVQVARIASSPFFNQDDLPPWERLTHKNPLFAIFLDELAWRGSITSTGTLLFQSKMPGLYPTAWSPSIFIDPGMHTS
jgi:hypothetical protein